MSGGECRLAGYAGSASLFSYSSGHTLLERQASSPRAAGQSGQAALVASHQALKSAVALCQRHSLEASQDTAHHLWFQLLQVQHCSHCRLALPSLALPCPASPCPALPCLPLPCPTMPCLTLHAARSTTASWPQCMKCVEVTMHQIDEL